MNEQRALRFKTWFWVSMKYFRVEDGNASADFGNKKSRLFRGLD